MSWCDSCSAGVSPRSRLQAEVLNSVLKDYQDHFPVVLFKLSRACRWSFGLEVDPSEHRYVLVPTLVLTLSEMLRDGQRLPKAGFLVVILCLIIKYLRLCP